MKRFILLLAIGTLAKAGEISYTRLFDYEGTIGSTVATQYIGKARTTDATTVTPSISNAVWSVQKYIYNAAGYPTSMQDARTSNGALWGNVWTNRLNLNYY